jgi:hypothetical protein
MRVATYGLTRVPRVLPLSLVVAVAFAASAGVVWAQQPHGVTIEQICSVWRARQERVKTLRFEIEEHRTTMKGSQIGREALPPQFRQPGEVLRAVLPEDDVTHALTDTVTIDGNKMRYTIEGMRWADPVEDFVPCKYIGVYNGAVPKSLNVREKNTIDLPPTGFILDYDHSTDQNLGLMFPILLHYRAFTPSIWEFDPSEWVVLPEQEHVGRRPCVVIQKEHPRTKGRQRYWVDAGRECAVVRFVADSPRGTFAQIDAAFQYDTMHGWIPHRWQYVFWQRGDGNITSNVTMIVSKWQINVPIDPSEFELEFAPGTVVNDHRAKNRYLITKGGGQRIITGGEFQRGAAYEELLRTDSGQAGLPSPRKRWTRYVWIASLSLGIAALGAYIIIKWRQRRS